MGRADDCSGVHPLTSRRGPSAVIPDDEAPA
jgi:hypothetical protein